MSKLHPGTMEYRLFRELMPNRKHFYFVGQAFLKEGAIKGYTKYSHPSGDTPKLAADMFRSMATAFTKPIIDLDENGKITGEINPTEQ